MHLEIYPNEGTAVSGVANVDQAAAWDGHEGDLWAENAARYEATGRRIWEAFLDRRPISAGDDVIDIGCGTGRSTRDAARLAAPGQVLGVDLSARMLDHARRRSAAEGLINVRFEQADAQVHPFEGESADVAISSFGVMFFADPVAAFTNIASALRPDGRLAMLAWGDLHRNQWVSALREALAVGRTFPEPPPSVPGPFGFAEPDHVRRVLDAAGFVDLGLETLEEPVQLGTDADDAFSFVSVLGMVEGMTQDLDEATKARALDELRRALRAHDTGQGVLLGSSAWLITAHRP